MIAGRLLLLHPACHPRPKQSTVRVLGETLVPPDEAWFYNREDPYVFYEREDPRVLCNRFGWAV